MDNDKNCTARRIHNNRFGKLLSLAEILANSDHHPVHSIAFEIPMRFMIFKGL
jgi:hypothetical protein